MNGVGVDEVVQGQSVVSDVSRLDLGEDLRAESDQIFVQITPNLTWEIWSVCQSDQVFVQITPNLVTLLYLSSGVSIGAGEGTDTGG